MKNSRIDLRITHAEKDIWQAHADKIGLTLTELITRSVRARVSSDISDYPDSASKVAPDGHWLEQVPA